MIHVYIHFLNASCPSTGILMAFIPELKMGGGGGNRFRPISHHAELCATEHLHRMITDFSLK